MTTANETLQLAWLEALRSGNYVQARNHLRINDGVGHGRFCCLGVACDIIGMGRWVAPLRYDHYLYEMPDGLTFHGIMPWQVSQLLGLQPFQENKLTEMNDAGASFEQIANYLEEIWGWTQPSRPIDGLG